MYKHTPMCALLFTHDQNIRRDDMVYRGQRQEERAGPEAPVGSNGCERTEALPPLYPATSPPSLQILALCDLPLSPHASLSNAFIISF